MEYDGTFFQEHFRPNVGDTFVLSLEDIASLERILDNQNKFIVASRINKDQYKAVVMGTETRDLPIDNEILSILRSQVGVAPKGSQLSDLIIQDSYLEELKEVYPSAGESWLDRALCFYYLLITEFKALGLPNRIYGSEFGIHLGWRDATIHVLVQADEDDDPAKVYSLQVFDKNPPYMWRATSFYNPRDVLNAALLESS